jgi:hypothetical protein
METFTGFLFAATAVLLVMLALLAAATAATHAFARRRGR